MVRQEQPIQLLEAFLALMPDAALVVDEEGRIVSVNQHTEALFGYLASDLVGRAVELLVPERFRPAHRRDRAEYLKAPRARPMGAGLELSGRRRDGSEFPVDISLAPLTDVGRPLAVAAVRDASERRAAQATEAQLAAIVQGSTDGIIAMTTDGRISSWNPGAEQLFGYPATEVVGRHISLLVPESSSTELEELMAAVLAGGTPGARDTQWLKRDGSRLQVALLVSALADSGGRPAGFSAVVRDIAERKQAEDQLRRLLMEERRLKRQQEATAEVRLALLAGTPVDEALALISQRACELLDAEASGISLLDNGELRVMAAAAGGAHIVGRMLTLEGSLAGRVLTTGTSQVVASLADEPGVDRALTASVPSGPALGVPLAAEGKVKGALVVTRSPGARGFDSQDVAFASGIAGQAALALELGRAREDREQIMLARDRDRIAGELHDLVIQRLFATGMRLQGVTPLISDRRVAERIHEVIDELDATIGDIRTTIFSLETGSSAPPFPHGTERDVSDDGGSHR